MNSFPQRNSMNAIVADDHPLWVKSFSDTVKKCDFINKVSPARNGVEVLDLLKKSKYDLVFLDIGMDEMDGEETAFHIAQDFPCVKTIAVSMHYTPKKIRQMYIVGCRSYILKAQDEKEILKSIKAVASGERYFHPMVIEKLALDKDEQKNLQLQEEFRLSPMEIRIIIHICEGKTSKEIAEVLKKKLRTIEKYREYIYDKTGTTNKIELHNFALKHHLIIE